MDTITGAVGVGGCAFITALPDAVDEHSAALVTVKVYDPAGIPGIDMLIPVPVLVVPPGVLVNVQEPVEGNPFRTAIPVARLQVGWVIVPTVGAVGVEGCKLITMLADAGDMQLEALVTM
jgi:hypothetical protein